MQSGTFGGRAFVLAAGTSSFESVASTGGTLTPAYSIRSVKLLHDGVITEIHAFLRLTLAQTDLTPSLVYAQLYAAPDFNTNQFEPIAESLIEFGQIPILSPAGRIFTFSRTGLSIPVTHGTQLLLCFYNNSTATTAGTIGYLSGVARIEEQ